MAKLFENYTLRNIQFRNRIWVSPMCQYSSEDGMPTDWHLVHLGSRAVGGAGMVMMEATGVSPEGRISPQDAGIWSDAHAEAYAPIVKFMKSHGAVAGIQLAHAGRKASTTAPWDGDEKVDETKGGWQTVAPSALSFKDNYPHPREMSKDDIEKAVHDFVAAAKRSVEAGFEVIEVHAAHGYLCHEFLSGMSMNAGLPSAVTAPRCNRSRCGAPSYCCMRPLFLIPMIMPAKKPEKMSAMCIPPCGTRCFWRVKVR